jgi:hypothetical protein
MSCQVQMDMPRSARCLLRCWARDGTGDLWIADHHGWTQECLCAMDTRGASVVIRQHRGLPCEIVNPLHPLGWVETGYIAAPRVCVVDAPGGKHGCRRRRLKRNHATRDGAPWLSSLTN